MILSCTQQFMSVLKMVKLVVLIIRIAAPVLLIIAGSRDFMSAIKDEDSDALRKAGASFVKKAIATVLIFFIPNFVLLLAKYASTSSTLANDLVTCYGDASIWSAGDKEAFKIPDPVENLACEVTINKEGTTSVKVTGRMVGEVYRFEFDNLYVESGKNDFEIDGIHKNIRATSAKSSTKVDCKLVAVNTYPVVEPESGGSIVASAESETLKVKIQKINSYYLSYIWVLDPYNQFNKEHASNYGSGRESLSSMLQRVINKNGNNKIYLATNASGFYVNGTWTPNSVSYNNKYNYTQEGGLVITNGQVIRNWYYNDAVDRSRNDTIYGINPKGYLVGYPKINDYTEEGRKQLFQKIIDDGIKDTITFRPQVIKDGQIINWSSNSGANYLTLFCQIDRNNFVLFHAAGSVERSATVKKLKDIGCQTAVNFDGGGSVSLFFKDGNSNIRTITGGSRTNVEIFYVSE